MPNYLGNTITIREIQKHELCGAKCLHDFAVDQMAKDADIQDEFPSAPPPYAEKT